MKTENGMENRTKGRKEKKIKNRTDVTLYVSSHIRDKINSRARAPSYLHRKDEEGRKGENDRGDGKKSRDGGRKISESGGSLTIWVGDREMP